MSIGQWFKNLFSGPAKTDAPIEVANETDDEVDINEARIDAGGSGPVGMSNDPASHADPGEQTAQAETEAD
jgi:hypothetical protein